MKYGLYSNYNFDSVDIITPDIIIQEMCDELNEITKGLVVGTICKYDGPIESYDAVSALAAISANLYATTRKDIQDKLGAMGNIDFKYELYLSAPHVENYKYRILFINYSIGGYPVEVVVEQGIADELNNEEDSGYIYTVESKDDFEKLMIGIFNSRILQKVIQHLITASERKLLPDKKE